MDNVAVIHNIPSGGKPWTTVDRCLTQCNSVWGKQEALTQVPRMLISDPVVTVTISTIVQLYLTWRIRHLNKSSFLIDGILFFIFSSFTGGVAATICTALNPEFEKLKQFRWAIVTWLASTALADLSISSYLVYFLLKNKSDCTKSSTVVNKIITLTIQTGTITAVATVADLITFMISPVRFHVFRPKIHSNLAKTKDTTFQFAWDFSVSKLYTNCLLSTLNARARWNKLLTETVPPNVSDVSFAHVAESNDPTRSVEKV
ncbi:hypothetical protein K435DRAFT_842290 [Dendrothele bispora CBS 962.96]|uniref:DUF6534 domain-containing protein n=1 Tax=Dendrothele bispora (strain CBS 962.96) TaxID=1314807 RepID=A0A4S8LGZ3_DENBC|nr:hypothetical protein K435DRAFT_842290 [Dendrothele bispora CBS 962.96]